MGYTTRQQQLDLWKRHYKLQSGCRLCILHFPLSDILNVNKADSAKWKATLNTATILWNYHTGRPGTQSSPPRPALPLDQVYHTATAIKLASGGGSSASPPMRVLRGCVATVPSAASSMPSLASNFKSFMCRHASSLYEKRKRCQEQQVLATQVSKNRKVNRKILSLIGGEGGRKWTVTATEQEQRVPFTQGAYKLPRRRSRQSHHNVSSFLHVDSAGQIE